MELTLKTSRLRILAHKAQWLSPAAPLQKDSVEHMLVLQCSLLFYSNKSYSQ